MDQILAADIGGTNSRFAAFDVDRSGRLKLVDQKWLQTQEADSFDQLLDQLEQSGFSLPPSTWQAAVLGVPGPALDRSFSTLANVPWPIDVRPLRQKNGTDKLFLINDFIAQAYACLTEAVSERIVIKPGQADPEAALAVIGAGTGLGHSALKPDGRGGMIPIPSEAGHAVFAFFGKDEWEFQKFLLAETRAPYAYGDLVVSGSGLSQLHRFLTGEKLSPKDVAVLPEQSETIQWFSRFFGRACRNFALTVLAQGGMFITAGVAGQNPHLVNNGTFRDEFVNSPAHHELLENIPVYLNRNTESGLWGAAFYGLKSLEED